MLQDMEIKFIRSMGHQAIVIDSRPRVDALIQWVCNVMKAKETLGRVL